MLKIGQKIIGLRIIYLIMAVVMAVTSFIQFRLWYFPVLDVIKYGGTIFFLSSFVFILAYLITLKYNRKIVHIIAIILCIASVLHWFALKEKVESSLSKMIEENTKVKQYNQILSEYWKSQEYLVKHFPNEISPEATNIKFSFLPHFLQGGAHIQLRYSLPQQEIAELYNKFYKDKINAFQRGNTYVDINSVEVLPSVPFYINDSDDTDLSKDFEIIVLNAKDEGGKHYEWNHGELSGVAISQQRNEIVYWAESW